MNLDEKASEAPPNSAATTNTAMAVRSFFFMASPLEPGTADSASFSPFQNSKLKSVAKHLGWVL